jgi:hypothetical protein
MSRKLLCSGVRWRLLGLIGIAAVALVGGMLAGLNAAEESSTAPNPSTSRIEAPKKTGEDSPSNAPKSSSSGGGRIDGYLAGGRWREGSKLVDVAGQFKTSGERVAFHAADGKSRFPCLENLNSERVARIVAESPPESLDWIVQGTLTEFRNENYLLVTQAVIGGRALRGTRPAADRRTPPAKVAPDAR